MFGFFEHGTALQLRQLRDLSHINPSLSLWLLLLSLQQIDV